MAIHKLGRRNKKTGELEAFVGTLNDVEFEREMDTLIPLPPGWVAWHIEESEFDPLSERVTSLRERPVACDAFGPLSWRDEIDRDRKIAAVSAV
jgi:hypothetical protein